MATGGSPITIREPSDDDLPAIREILAAHGNDGAIVVADVVGPYLRHLIRRGGARISVQDGVVVGFGATIDTGRAVHLADLFVRPDRLGHGIGRPLLDAVFEGAVHRTTFASDDPRALPLYVRAGMRPLWVSLYIEGSGELIPAGPRSLTTESVAADALAAIERDWTGADRTADYRFWATQAAADPFLVRDGADVVAVGTARVRQASAVRVLDRLVVAPDDAVDPVPVLLTALRRAAAGGPVLVCVQGPNPLVRVLLDLRFRIMDRDQFMASEPDLVDPLRLIPNPGML